MTKAIQYWKPLAEAGDCDAQYRYGTLFALGAGVPKAPATAVEWWLKAANQGQYRAQVMLTTAYARQSTVSGSFVRQFQIDCRDGCGVDLDLVSAYSWLVVARASTPATLAPFQRALAEQMSTLGARLTAEEKASAEGRAAGWQPSPTRCTPRELK